MLRFSSFILALVVANPVQAMTACDLPSLIPMTVTDYGRVQSLINQQAKCKSAPVESAHSQMWDCEIEFSGGPGSGRAMLMLIREPDQVPNLIVLTTGLENLNDLKDCPASKEGQAIHFTPTNIVERDYVEFSSRGAFYLNALFPDVASVIISSHSTLFRNMGYYYILQAQFGIEPPSTANTSIRFAGANPFKVPAESIVNAFVSRGSRVQSTNAEAKAFTNWELTPPIGIGGATKIDVGSVGQNLYYVKYHFDVTEHYSEFVRSLDAEYGSSRLTPYRGCNLRQWTSSDMRVVGRYCPKGATNIEFINSITQSQLSAALDKMEAREKAVPRTSKPEIDRDMM